MVEHSESLLPSLLPWDTHRANDSAAFVPTSHGSASRRAMSTQRELSPLLSQDPSARPQEHQHFSNTCWPHVARGAVEAWARLAQVEGLSVLSGPEYQRMETPRCPWQLLESSADPGARAPQGVHTLPLQRGSSASVMHCTGGRML